MNAPIPEVLVIEWLEAKQAEVAANLRRVACEKLIIEQTGVREEGSRTHDIGRYKVTVSGKLKYTMDLELFDACAGQVPEELRPIKVRREADETGIRYLRANEPQIYQLFAHAVTITSAKTAVSIKEAE